MSDKKLLDREPTEEMLKASGLNDYEASACWYLMFDASPSACVPGVEKRYVCPSCGGMLQYPGADHHHCGWTAAAASENGGLEDDPVVGHKTMRDGSHIPLRQHEASLIIAACHKAKAARDAAMPDERAALRSLTNSHIRLTDLGWRDACYCPKDGSSFDVIEAGSSGIHTAHYSGEWPSGSWWIEGDGDLWPSRPILFRPSPAKKAEGERCGQCHKCREGQTVNLGTDERPWKVPFASTQMIVCETCGNKRCPHATDCALACTDSNEPGQKGSAYA